MWSYSFLSSIGQHVNDRPGSRVHVDGVRCLKCGHKRSYYSSPDEYMSIEPWWNDIDRGNWRTRRKTCPNATLSSTDLTWTDPGANPGLRSENQESNFLSNYKTRPGYCFSPLKQEVRLNIIYKFCSNLNQNSTLLFTEIIWLMLVREIITVYSENHMKPLNTLSGQSADFLTVKVGYTKTTVCWGLKS
jgi:hypothetical protein